jgi:hypothetical protein
MNDNTNSFNNLNYHNPLYIQKLTYKLDNIKKYNKNPYTRDEIENLLGDEINKLLKDKNKSYILDKWKYGKYFKLTEKAHENGFVLFGQNTSWIQSFIIGLLMYSFH